MANNELKYKATIWYDGGFRVIYISEVDRILVTGKDHKWQLTINKTTLKFYRTKNDALEDLVKLESYINKCMHGDEHPGRFIIG